MGRTPFFEWKSDAIRDDSLFATSFSSTLNSGSLSCKQLCSGTRAFWGHWAEMAASRFNFRVWAHLDLQRKNRHSSECSEMEHGQICPNIELNLQALRSRNSNNITHKTRSGNFCKDFKAWLVRCNRNKVEVKIVIYSLVQLSNCGSVYFGMF